MTVNEDNANRKFLWIYDNMRLLAERFSEEFKNASKRFFIKVFGGTTDITMGYSSATMFEVCVFFIFWADFCVFKHKQNEDTRQRLGDFLTNQLAVDFRDMLENKDLLAIINQRLEGYGKIIRSCSADSIMERLYSFELLQNIGYSQNANTLKLWDSKGRPVLISEVFEVMALKTGIAEAKNIVDTFGCCLKHLCQDNDDLTQLTSEEIDKRFNEGVTEATEHFIKKQKE